MKDNLASPQDSPELTAKRNHVCQILAHHMVFLATQLKLSVAGKAEQFVLENATERWNKKGSFQWSSNIQQPPVFSDAFDNVESFSDPWNDLMGEPDLSMEIEHQTLNYFSQNALWSDVPVGYGYSPPPFQGGLCECNISSSLKFHHHNIQASLNSLDIGPSNIISSNSGIVIPGVNVCYRAIYDGPDLYSSSIILYVYFTIATLNRN